MGQQDFANTHHPLSLRGAGMQPESPGRGRDWPLSMVAYGWNKHGVRSKQPSRTCSLNNTAGETKSQNRGRTQVPKGQDNLGKDTKDMEVARIYEQHLGISESRRHAALPLYYCFLLFLPEVPGNTGMGTREKVPLRGQAKHLSLIPGLQLSPRA